MVRNIRVCPTCREPLVFPRGDHPYCEECGWPDEDFDGTHLFPKVGDQLGDLQPGLEVYDPKLGWGPSGVITCRLTESHRGFYRKRRQEIKEDRQTSHNKRVKQGPKRAHAKRTS